MIKPIVSKGVIIPHDRLPEDWLEGTEVAVEECSDDAHTGLDPTDAWMDEVDAIARQGDREDDNRLSLAIQDIRSREKELARKKAGLAQ